MTAHVELLGLSKRYGETVAVDDVTLEIAKGESVGLLGPSGCGKTTTLRMLAGLIAPTGGSVSVRGRDVTSVPAHRRNMGYVFQSYALFPHLSVAANIGFGLDERGVSRADRDRRVGEAMAQVRLTGLGERRPRELSGGQQQRVALARALVIEPDVLLLDESLSNLDAKLRDAMRFEIRDLQRSLSLTTLLVTHDQTEALTMCDRIAVMNAGRIEQVASPQDIYDRPASRFVADFVGRSTVLKAVTDGSGALMVAGRRIRSPAPVARPAEVFLRPHRLSLRLAGEPIPDGHNSLPGVVGSHAFAGGRIEVIVESDAGRVLVELPHAAPVPPEGTAVDVLWRVEDTLVFPEPGS